VVPPLATISPVGSVTAGGDTTEQIVVTYSEKGGQIDASSIGAGNLVVTGPASQALTVTGVTTVSLRHGGSVSASYTVAAPGGPWDAADNGTYTVTVQAGAGDGRSGERRRQGVYLVYR
jgi:hypothetical protein